MSDLPFNAKNELESRILADPEFLAGLDHGWPRPGHPEGAVKWHIADVLGNVEQWYCQTDLYSRLRLIALIHDTFKYQVDPGLAGDMTKTIMLRAVSCGTEIEILHAGLPSAILREMCYLGCRNRSASWLGSSSQKFPMMNSPFLETNCP
ncbi:MAG TPA: hypothetical protein VNQ76_07285 [Planctomicrobium sp.]|nr:hypothetical protein [Planctomicrobium sp.]